MDTGDFYGIASHTYGNNGDLYYRTDENILYRKYNDTWHVENAFGNVTTGDVAPDNANGDDGDQYINIATGDFYRKNAGVWELESNLLDQFTRFGYWFSAFTNVVGIPENFETVEIVGNITEIKAGTFADCEYIKEVILPDSVTIIGDHAFDGCYYLKTINMPSSLNTIGDYAFSDCPYLDISHIENVNSIGECAFSWCGITHLTLSNIGEIKESAFVGCELMVDLQLVDTEKIGTAAFYGCSSLSIVDVATTGGHINLEIGDYAFQSCRSLKNFVMANKTKLTIKSLGEQAFMDCTSLLNIDLSLLECDISSNAFKNCISLNNVLISDSVRNIGASAFEGCSSLSYIEIGTSVDNIGDFAFRNCISLVTLNIKSTQEMTIGNAVFTNCYSLNKVIYAGEHSTWTSNFYDKLGSLDNKWFSGVAIKCSNETFTQA